VTRTEHSPRATAGITQALLAAVLFGISTPIAKGLLEGTSPQLLAGMLYLGSGTGLGLLWLVQRAVRRDRHPTVVTAHLARLGQAAPA